MQIGVRCPQPCRKFLDFYPECGRACSDVPSREPVQRPQVPAHIGSRPVRALAMPGRSLHMRCGWASSGIYLSEYPEWSVAPCWASVAGVFMH